MSPGHFEALTPQGTIDISWNARVLLRVPEAEMTESSRVPRARGAEKTAVRWCWHSDGGEKRERRANTETKTRPSRDRRKFQRRILLTGQDNFFPLFFFCVVIDSVPVRRICCKTFLPPLFVFCRQRVERVVLGRSLCPGVNTRGWRFSAP